MSEDQAIDFNQIKTVLRNADETLARTSAGLQGTVADALAAMGAGEPAEPPPTFTGHSGALVARMMAEADALKQVIASIDAEINAENDRRDANVSRLDAQRTDAMLAYSMLTHGMQARESGT